MNKEKLNGFGNTLNRQLSRINDELYELIIVHNGLYVSSNDSGKYKCTLYTAMTGAANQQKWKMLDCRVLGFIAGTISNSLTTYVNYDWEDQTTCPSMSTAF